METSLTTSEAKFLQNQYGKNEIQTQKSFSIFSLFLSQFPTVINGILAFAGIFSFIIREPVDGVFIFTVLILNALLGFIQEFRAEKALQKLKTFSQPLSIVLRDGIAIELHTHDVVPKDIVILSEGDRIPADGVIISSSHLEIDESILTGESLPVEKNNKDLVFQGAFVARGKGKMVVTQIGMETKLGKLTKSLTTIEEHETPLQKQISSLAKLLSYFALGLSLLILPIGIFYGRSFAPLLLVAISIGVAAIPESLPAVITIALALGTNLMARKNAIVRQLASIETIGAVQIILTDKTGTLTQNDMRVKEHFIVDQKKLHDVLHACVIGNTALLAEKDGETYVIGDKTDGALLLWAENQQISIKGESQGAKVLDEFTFDPLSKTITTVAVVHEKPLVIVRGAPESVLTMCALDETQKDVLEKQYEFYAMQGLRVIALAQKHEPNHKNFSRKELETNLEFLGFMCLYDPPRLNARESVENAQKAGIRVIMVTGDNPLTAKAIASEVGILDGNETVVTGMEINNMNIEQLKQAMQVSNVFARTTPEHKMLLVEEFQALGFIVGVTGDGVNDALALKKADVGLSMGKKGTDVAKEASDIILADDNFATFMEAVKMGRKIYANIVNAITYLIAGNLAELGLIFFATVFNIAIPLLPTQILWINLVTDGLPALALASDRQLQNFIQNKPRNREEPILTKNRMLFVGTVGLMLAIALLIIFMSLNHVVGIEKARTIVFSLMVLSQMILAFVVRGKQSIFSNKFLLITIVITILLQIIITTYPPLQSVFHVSI